jgi:hypothetical protein
MAFSTVMSSLLAAALTARALPGTPLAEATALLYAILVTLARVRLLLRLS